MVEATCCASHGGVHESVTPSHVRELHCCLTLFFPGLEADPSALSFDHPPHALLRQEFTDTEGLPLRLFPRESLDFTQVLLSEQDLSDDVKDQVRSWPRSGLVSN